MPNPQMGVLSKLYINVGHDEVDLVDNLTVNGSWNSSPANSRRSIVDVEEPTTMGLELSGTILFDPDSTVYQAIRDAWIQRSPLLFLAMTGPLDEDGMEGIEFTGKVLGWNDDQGRQAIGYREFTIKPCVSDTPARYATVVGGVLTFDEFGQTVS